MQKEAFCDENSQADDSVLLWGKGASEQAEYCNSHFEHYWSIKIRSVY